MKLNKYQKAWIEKLLSGTTRKAKGKLFKSNRMCCLGVAESVCKFHGRQFLDKLGGLTEETMKELKLRDSLGSFLLINLSKKWKNILLKHEINANSLSLAWVNDTTTLSHVQLGQMINENRKAFFKS